MRELFSKSRRFNQSPLLKEDTVELRRVNA